MAAGCRRGDAVNNDNASAEGDATEPQPVATSPDLPLVVSVVPRRAGWRRLRGSTPIALSPILRAVPEILHALQSGDMVRIVGARELLDGIKTGTLRYMQGEAGHFTTVIDQNGRIVGQVQLEASRFAQTGRALAVFQVASAITLQYYLQRFDERLDAISSAVRKAREHAAWAEVSRAMLEAPRFAEDLQKGSALSPGLRNRLDTEERACDVVALQELLPVQEAIAGLESTRREIDQLDEARAKRGPVGKAASAVVETGPGGLRGRLAAALAAADEAMIHWQIACSAAHVHAALVALQMVDDELAGRPETTSALKSVAARAENHRTVAGRVGELLALPDETLDLFGLDGGIIKRLRSLDEVALTLRAESEVIAAQLDLISEGAISEMVLVAHKDEVVALSAVDGN